MESDPKDTSKNNTSEGQENTDNVVMTKDDEIKAALDNSKIKEKQKKNKKLQVKMLAALLVAALIGGVLYWGFMPRRGSMAYGICKVFLELNIRYPDTLHVNGVKESSNWVRVWYAHTDSFGEFKMEPIQCYFKQDETYGMILERVTIRRRELDQKKVEAFNKSISVVLQHPPDLVLPPRLPDSLKGLQFNTDSFRFNLGLRKQN